MKKNSLLTVLTLFVLIAITASSCGKREVITVTKDILSFSAAGGTDHIQISANCGWSIVKDESVDWFSITPTEGENNGLITITVNNYEESPDREALFTIKSASGKKSKTIVVHQNEIEITNITDCVWFVSFYERWNTDYYQNFIEDSYEYWSYNQGDNERNIFFYFMPDSTGYQIQTQNQDTIFYLFDYIFYPLGDSLYINFASDDELVDDYHSTIDALNDDTFIFSDEWKPNFFEKITMIKFVGASKLPYVKINPYKISKKKSHGPLVDVE